MKPQSNSPMALSKASLWYHMKNLFNDLCDAIHERAKESIVNVFCLWIFCWILALAPITFPIFAFFRRQRYRKMVEQWGKNNDT